MKFMLFVCADREAYDHYQRERAESASEASDGAEESMPWADDLDAAGIRLDGDELGSYRDATTVRVRGGEVLLGDGPFVETKEVIIGYDIIDCADLDEAVAIAARHPVAAGGMIEVRPFRG